MPSVKRMTYLTKRKWLWCKENRVTTKKNPKWKNGEDSNIFLLKKTLFILLKSHSIRLSLGKFYLQIPCAPGRTLGDSHDSCLSCNPHNQLVTLPPLPHSQPSPWVHPHCSGLSSGSSYPPSFCPQFCSHSLQYKPSLQPEACPKAHMRRLNLNASHGLWNKV